MFLSPKDHFSKGTFKEDTKQLKNLFQTPNKNVSIVHIFEIKKENAD